MEDRNRLLQDTLYQLGITRVSRGYELIFSAVLKVVDDPDKLFWVTKNLYFDLAKETGSSLSKIEKNLRGCAEKAWEHNPEYLKKITHLDLTERPTSTELIDLLAIYIERTMEDKNTEIKH